MFLPITGGLNAKRNKRKVTEKVSVAIHIYFKNRFNCLFLMHRSSNLQICSSKYINLNNLLFILLVV
jgi:hypothetical protein